MISNKRILAIIPARGGSKGIPNKNIIDVLGKPLIQYTIDAAKQSKYIDHIEVSTDSEQILNVAQAIGINSNRLRPALLATDESKTIDTVIDVLHFLKEKNEFFDYVVILQPTQPLRQTFHIDQAIEIIVQSGEDSLTSVNLVKDHPLLYRKIENDKLVNLLDTSSTVRRQDFPSYYKVNGAIYINKVNESLTSYTSLNDNRIPYIMDAKYDLDVDEPIDIDIMKLLLPKLELK